MKIEFVWSNIMLLLGLILLSSCKPNSTNISSVKQSSKEKSPYFKRVYPSKNGLDGLYKISLDEDLYNHIASNFKDVRMYERTSDDEFIEVPFKVEYVGYSPLKKYVTYQYLDQSKTSQLHTFLFKTSSPDSIDRLNLIFKNEVYNWNVSIDAGSDPMNLINIISDYNMFSLGGFEKYSNNLISFKKGNYPYVRISVKSDEDVKISQISQFFSKDPDAGPFKDISISEILSKDLDSTFESEIQINLSKRRSVAKVTFDVDSDTLDYFKPLVFRYLKDSLLRNDIWSFRYRPFLQSHISSLDKCEYDLPERLTKSIKMEVRNINYGDLKIGNLKVFGYDLQFIAHLKNNSNYFLFYGDHDLEGSHLSLKLKDLEEAIFFEASLGEHNLNTSFDR